MIATLTWYCSSWIWWGYILGHTVMEVSHWWGIVFSCSRELCAVTWWIVISSHVDSKDFVLTSLWIEMIWHKNRKAKDNGSRSNFLSDWCKLKLSRGKLHVVDCLWYYTWWAQKASWYVLRVIALTPFPCSNHHRFEPQLYDRWSPHVSVGGLKFLLAVDKPVNDRLIFEYFFLTLDEWSATCSACRNMLSFSHGF